MLVTQPRDTKVAVSSTHSFRNGDLVEIETISVRAVARIREAGTDGRLHVAFEQGEYMPWVDTDVQIRQFGNDPSRSCTARILHAGSTTALLQLITVIETRREPEPVRAPYDTIPSLDEEPLDR